MEESDSSESVLRCAPGIEVNEAKLLSTRQLLLRVFSKQFIENSLGGVCLVYTMLNNQESSKFDLYLPGKLVASLHYKIDDNVDEVMFVYCEAIAAIDSDAHCRELMQKALEEAHARWLRVNVACPIALKYMRQNASLKSSRASEGPGIRDHE